MSATTSELLVVLDRLVARAGAGEAIEAYGVDETETMVSARSGAVETLSSARTRGIGLRVLSEGRFGYAHTSDLGEASLDEALEAARANARATTPDEANVLPEPAPAKPVPGLLAPGAADVEVEAKVDAALRLEARVLAAGDPVTGVDAARYGDVVGAAAIATTTGVRDAFEASHAFVIVEAIAERNGESAAHFGLDLGRDPRDLDVDGAAAEAVLRTTRLLGGRKPEGRRLPVVLDPFVTAELLGVLAGPLSAEAAQRGRSVFADKVGEQLGPAHLTLVDDGRHPDGPSSVPRDGEGTPTQRTTLLRDGTLEGFLHDVRTAARSSAGGQPVRSTGNATRGSHRAPPGLGPTNLYLEPGPATPQDVIARAGEAFYCQRVMGLHAGANPISGEISAGASGLMIRGGELAEPVREASIAGTIPQLLAGLETVGADLRFLPFGGGLGGATVLVDELTLAGS